MCRHLVHRHCCVGTRSFAEGSLHRTTPRSHELHWQQPVLLRQNHIVTQTATPTCDKICMQTFARIVSLVSQCRGSSYTLHTAVLLCVALGVWKQPICLRFQCFKLRLGIVWCRFHPASSCRGEAWEDEIVSQRQMIRQKQPDIGCARMVCFTVFTLLLDHVQKAPWLPYHPGERLSSGHSTPC